MVMMLNDVPFTFRHKILVIIYRQQMKGSLIVKPIIGESVGQSIHQVTS